jgi:hypothetical protein
MRPVDITLFDSVTDSAVRLRFNLERTLYTGMLPGGIGYL